MKVSFNNNATKKRNAAKLTAVLLVSLMMLASVLTAAILAGFKVPAAQGSESGTAAPVWDGTVASSFAGGDGTSAATAYEISTGAELALLAREVNAGNATNNASTVYYKLTNDIVLNDTSALLSWIAGGASVANTFNQWTAIGYYSGGGMDYSKAFKANFDGAGFSVKGIYINKTGTVTAVDNYQGLFGNVYGGKISNVGVEQSYTKGYTSIGGIAGYVSGGTVTNCYNTGAVTGTRNVGGIAGYVAGGGTVTNCYNTGAVMGTGNYVGGIAGNFLGGTVTNCYNTGTVSGEYYVGGVAGSANNGTVTNCYNTGAVSGSSSVGGVVGSADSGTVTNCYFLTGKITISDELQTVSDEKAIGSGSGTTAVFDSSGVITANSGIANITVNTTTLLSALNAWITANNSGGGYNTWYGAPFPTFNAPVKIYKYTITGSGSSFAAEGENDDGSTYAVKTGAIQTVVDTIKADANGKDAEIIFGNGSALNIGSSYISFTSGWGIITLRGSITSSDGTSSHGTIYIGGDVSIVSYADITNTASSYGRAIFNASTGTINVSGGTVQVTGSNGRAISHNSTGTINISGGKVQVAGSSNYAIYNNSTGLISVSGDAEITSACTLNPAGTIYLANGAENQKILTITGGTVKNTANDTRARAICNAGKGNIEISGGTVQADTGVAIYNVSTGKITIGQDAGNTTTVTSKNVTSASGTIYLEQGTANQTILSITGGTVRNEGGDEYSRAVYNNDAGDIKISGGTVSATGNGTAIYNVSTGSIAISNGEVSAIAYYAIHNYSSGSITISGGKVSATGSGIAIYNNGAGEIAISGGTVSATTGYAIYNNSTGVITISQDTGKTTLITSANITSTNPGTIYLASSGTEPANRLVITGGTVQNTGTGIGSAIYNNSNGAVTISSGTVQNTSIGYAIFSNSAGVLTISGGTVSATSNSAINNNSTGAIIISGGTVSATSGKAINNLKIGTVTITGGTVSATTGVAIYNDSTGSITISEADSLKPTKVTSKWTNSSYGSGTIHLENGSSGNTILTITGGTVENTASTYGIVINNRSAGAINISGGTVSATTCNAIYNNSTGTVTITSGTVSATTGNAISNMSAGTININGGTVSATATTGRAVYNYSAGTININGGTVSATTVDYAVYCFNTNGTVVLGGDPIITGKISYSAGKLSVITTETTDKFAPAEGRTYTVELSGTVASGNIAVCNSNVSGGTDFSSYFTIANAGFGLVKSGNDLVSAINSYTVTYNLNGGSGTAPTAASVDHGGTISTNPGTSGFTMTGYTNDGKWYTRTGSGTEQSPYSYTEFVFGASGTGTAVTGNITLYLKWTINSYIVAYNLNGGSGTAPTAASVDHGGTISTKPDTSGFTLTGYTNDGKWYTRTGSGTEQSPYSYTEFVFGASGTGTAVTGNITLYLKWTINSYTVTYDLNGGSGTAPTAASVDHGGTISTNPGTSGFTMTGYTNDGKWYTRTGTSGSYTYTEFAFGASGTGTAVTGNITLYLKWTINSYIVAYNLNGGSGTAPTAASVDHGGTISTKPDTSGFTLTGYTNDGKWYTRTGSGTEQSPYSYTEFVFGASGTGTAVTGNITLYLKWTINSYTVTYDLNGGSGTAPTAASVDHGGTISTNPGTSGFTMTGYTNDGKWYTRTGTSGSYTYTEFAFGASGTGTAVTGNITLYLKWTINSYTVTVPSTQTNYSISNNAATATHGTDYTFTVAAAAGYKIAAVTYTIGSGSPVSLILASGGVFGTASYTVAGANVTGAFTLSVTVESVFDGGSGTLSAPYLIATAEQLKNLSELINAGNVTYNASTIYYKLTANIALNNTANWTTWSDTTAPTNTWIAIGYYSGSGTYSKAFKANFDGNGKTVSGIYINNSSDYQGLFGYVSGGKISNLGVEKSYIKGKDYVGGVAGYLYDNSGNVTNCYNTGSVSGSGNFVGGVAGYANDSRITNCYNTGSVSGSGNFVGGVAGAVAAVMINCSNTGAVLANGSAGGIAGNIENIGVVENCYNTGAVSGGSAGGIAGNSFGKAHNCYNIGVVSGGVAGGIVGSFNGEGKNCYYLSGSAPVAFGSYSWAENIYSFDASGALTPSTQSEDNNVSATTLLAALNGWVTANNSGGGYKPWYVFVFPVFDVHHEVTLPTGTGYTASGAEWIKDGTAYTFTVAATAGYDLTTLSVTATGTHGTISISGGTVTIPNVTSAITVSISISKLKYTVSFDLDGSSSGTTPLSITNVEHGTTLTTAQKPATTGFTKAGYNLDNGKWYLRTGAGTSGDPYVYDEFIFGTGGTEVTAATTLYLKWTAAAVNISTTSLTGGTYNTSYTASISASVASNAGGTLSYAVQTISGDGLPSGLTLNSSTGAITGTPSAAGSYTFTVRVTNAASGQYADKQLTIVVAKVTVSSITLPSASGITYGAALSTSTLSGGSSDGSFAWAAGTTIPTVSNSGYNVVFTPTDTNNYDYSGITGWNGTAKTITQNVSITVTARDITVTPDSGISKTYGGTDPALTFTVTTGSLVPGDSLTGVLSRVVGENAGSYNILQGTLTSANNPNYNITFVAGSIKFTINTASVIKPSNGAAGLYYTAAVQSNNITANAAYIIAASLTGGTNAAFRASSGTNAGTYYVKAVLNDKTNYEWEDGTTADIELTWSIAKAAVSSVTFPTSAGITYGAALSTSALSGGSTALGSFAWENGTTIPTVSNSGYNVVFTPADLANYDFSGITDWDGTAKTITRTVQIAVSRIGITAAMFTVEAAEYTGGVLSPAVSLTAAGAGVTYSIGAYANNTNAGVGTASVQITGTGNYSGTITVYFTISKKPVAVSAPSYSGGILTYGDSLPSISGTTSGGTYALNAGQTLTAGTNNYNWTFTPTDTSNFEWSGLTGTISLTVAKRQVAVAAPTYTGGILTYGDSLPSISGTTSGGTYALVAGQVLTAGTNNYNWTFTPADTSNFEWSGLTGTISLTVLKAAGSGSVSMDDWTFGETEKNPVPVSSTNGTANVTYQYKTRGADDNTYTTVKPSTAGNYTVKATFAATENYNSVSVTVNFTIYAAAITNPTEDPSEVVVEGQGGTKIDPDATLHLEDVSATVLVSGITDGKDVLAVYDVFMLLEGAKVQPDGEIKITIKLTEEQLNATDLKLLVQNGDVWEEKEFTLNDDGTITYFASNLSKIAFTADILSGGDVNLAWLIVLLTIILVLEGCFAALCFVLTRKNKKGTTKTYSFAALPVIFAAISPAGALPVIIIELVAIIGLAVWIVLMFRQNPELAGQLKQTAKDAGGKTKEVAKSVAGKTKSAFSAVRSKITKKKDKTQYTEKTDTCISATETAEETDTDACGDGDEEILLTIPEEELTQEDILEVETADSDDGDGQTETVNLEAEEKAAESGEVVIDDETKQILEEAAKEREAFVAAKKAGEKPEVPALRFTLSREDVIDRLEDMSSQIQNFPVEPIVVLKSKKHYCDTLRCGEWCFGLMYERKNVIKFTLRIDENFASGLAEKYTAFKKAAFPKGEGWYDLVIDSSFSGKNDVFEILDAAYAFVLARYYREENTVYVTDIEAAKEDAQTVVSEITENAAAPDPVLELAIEEREEALNKYRERNKIAFKMARKRILFYAAKNKELKDGTVKQPSKRHLPASLKAGGSTYALVYEKGYKEQDENGQEQIKIYVSLTVRIPDGYAAWLALRHPEVCRARFPKNRNWYVVPVDGSFPNAQMVYRVLKRAKKFVSKY